MEPLVEFHVSSLWGLKPYGVREIISSTLKTAGYENARFLFDARRNWFQITSQQDDEKKIRLQLKQWLEAAEEIAQDEDDDLVDDDGALLKSLDQNTSFGPWDEAARLEAVDFTEYRLPNGFDDVPHTRVWEMRGHGSLGHLLTKEQFLEMKELHSVMMEPNQSRTEVYIGASSKVELDRVSAKFDVMLKIKDLNPSQPTHLLWTEAYKEQDGVVMTFDTRFLANIDHGYIAATYLDIGSWPGSVDGYEMLAKSITVRLCRYDGHRGHHTSLIGPKLKGWDTPLKIAKRRYKARTSSARPYGAGIEPKIAASIAPKKTVAVEETAKSPYGGGDVQTWLNQLEERYGIATTSGHQGHQESRPGSREAPQMPSELHSDAPINLDGPVADDAHDVAPGEKENGRPESQSQPLLDLDDDPFVSTEKAAAPTSFPIGHVNSNAENGVWTNVPMTRNAGRMHLPVNYGAHAMTLGRGAGARAASMRNGSKQSTATNTSTAQKSAKSETVAAQLPAWFIKEVNTAIESLVATGPYLRGKVSLRVDLGRILITGMDYTGLAFNAPGSRSNGWVKDTLVQILNVGSRGTSGLSVAFTKMLTDDGNEIPRLYTTSDMATGAPIWKSEPSERVVYSFYCVSKGETFLLDVEADESGAKFNYSLRSRQDDSAPVWIHCTLRSWDARIVMSHANTAALDKKYGDFAQSLVDSFSVTLHEDTGPQVHIGVPRSFDVSVEAMRINTHFRFPSVDEKSFLDITEVEETVFKAGGSSDTATSGEGESNAEERMFYLITPKRLPSVVEESEKRGMPTYWYEASVRSVHAERLMAANQDIDLGEKADWDFNTLSKLGVIASIVKPTMRMAQTMDTVGTHNDNRQFAAMVLPRANTQEVPGANYLTYRRDYSPASSIPSRQRIPVGIPAAPVRPIGPPGTVAFRPHGPSPRRGVGLPTPPPTVRSPLPAAARVAGAAPAGVTSPAQKRAETGVACFSSNNKNIVKAKAPGLQGRHDPSSGSSDAARPTAASHKPKGQFW